MPTHASSRISLSNFLLNLPNMPQTLPSIFVSHGSPMIAIENSTATQAMNKIGQNLPKPRLIVLMSAHWQSNHLEINGNPVPKTWHDFGGFDKKLYDIQYPAHGEPAAAEALAEQLQSHGVSASINRLRPFDHGVWTPLIHLYPAADVPILQISIPLAFDSYACYQLGALLAPLRHEQVLIMGSGSITHNLYDIQPYSDNAEPQAHAFKLWIQQQLRVDMAKALDWQTHEYAKKAHPTPEHLLPLFFAAGAGQVMSSVHESTAHYSLGMDIYRFD